VRRGGRQELGVGDAAGSGPRLEADDDDTHGHRTRERPAAHLVHARHEAGPRAQQRTLVPQVRTGPRATRPAARHRGAARRRDGRG